MATVTGVTSDGFNSALALKADAATVTSQLAMKADISAAVMRSNNLSDVANAATARTNLNVSQRIWFDVRDYGAKGDGTTDDTASINSAISAADAVGGGTIYFPRGTYKTSANITLWADNLVIKGANKGNTIIKPVSGSTFDVFATPIPATAGTGGYTQHFLGIEGITIDCSAMASTSNGRGNAIHYYGVIQSYIRDVTIFSCPNWGIVLDGDATNFSSKVEIRANYIEGCGGGILATYSDECSLLYNFIDGANLAVASSQPMFDAPDTVGYPIHIKSGFGFIEGNIVGNAGTYTSPALQVESSETMRISNNRFNQTRYQAIRCIGDNNIIEGNQFSNCSSVGAVEVLRLGSKNNIVIGNRFDILAGSAHYTYCVYEPSAKGSNVVVGNQVVAGTSGAIHMDPSSTANRVSDNVGYNPVGPITSPTIPTSTTAFTNNYGSNAMVYITGGTVTAVTVGGTATGLTSGGFRVPSGQTIAITYSVAPTWKWFLD